MQKLAAFGHNVERGRQSGELNPQVEPLLVFNSILALVMLPQATGKLWARVNAGASFDRATLERHVIALLMQGMSGEPHTAQTAAPARRPRRK
jgi:hypothetical protein